MSLCMQIIDERSKPEKDCAEDYEDERLDKSDCPHAPSCSRKVGEPSNNWEEPQNLPTGDEPNDATDDAQNGIHGEPPNA